MVDYRHDGDGKALIDSLDYIFRNRRSRQTMTHLMGGGIDSLDLIHLIPASERGVPTDTSANTTYPSLPAHGPRWDNLTYPPMDSSFFSLNRCLLVSFGDVFFSLLEPMEDVFLDNILEPMHDLTYNATFERSWDQWCIRTYIMQAKKQKWPILHERSSQQQMPHLPRKAYPSLTDHIPFITNSTSPSYPSHSPINSQSHGPKSGQSHLHTLLTAR